MGDVPAVPANRHLVLGGSGFIGRHLALALLRRGETVVVADRHPPRALPAAMLPAAAPRAAFVALDLATADLAALLQDGDVVHHCAWSTIPKTANDDPLADLDTNLRGTLRLLDALAARAGTRLVFASSGGTVYGRLRETPVREDHPLDPITAYGVSKLAAEKYIGFYRASRGLDARIARISNPYGIGQDPWRKQGAASVFLHRALAGQPIEVWGDGSVVRDYLHVADLTAGLLALADAPATASGPAVFNLGSGEGVSIDRLLAALGARLQRALAVDYLGARAFDVPVNVLDISRAREHLGWSPRLDLAAGLDRAVLDHAAGLRDHSTLLDEAAGARRAAA